MEKRRAEEQDGLLFSPYDRLDLHILARRLRLLGCNAYLDTGVRGQARFLMAVVQPTTTSFNGVACRVVYFPDGATVIWADGQSGKHTTSQKSQDHAEKQLVEEALKVALDGRLVRADTDLARNHLRDEAARDAARVQEISYESVDFTRDPESTPGTTPALEDGVLTLTAGPTAKDQEVRDFARADGSFVKKDEYSL